MAPWHLFLWTFCRTFFLTCYFPSGYLSSALCLPNELKARGKEINVSKKTTEKQPWTVDSAEEKREKEKGPVGSVAPEYREMASVFLGTLIAPAVPSRGLEGSKSHPHFNRKKKRKQRGRREEERLSIARVNTRCGFSHWDHEIECFKPWKHLYRSDQASVTNIIEWGLSQWERICPSKVVMLNIHRKKP